MLLRFSCWCTPCRLSAQDILFHERFEADEGQSFVAGATGRGRGAQDPGPRRSADSARSSRSSSVSRPNATGSRLDQGSTTFRSHQGQARTNGKPPAKPRDQPHTNKVNILGKLDQKICCCTPKTRHSNFLFHCKWPKSSMHQREPHEGNDCGQCFPKIPHFRLLCGRRTSRLDWMICLPKTRVGGDGTKMKILLILSTHASWKQSL